MTCDVCNREILENENQYYGRWVLYCEECNKSGKGEEVDNKKTFENEVAPDFESGDFSYTLENGLEEFVI